MYELTLHVNPVGTQKYLEVITVNSNYMHDKIANFIRLTSVWNFKNDRYYDAMLFKDKLKEGSKALEMVLDMGVEQPMRKQIWQVIQLLEELHEEIEKLKRRRIKSGLYNGVFLRWSCS